MGNRLNDDGSITETMKQRLETAVYLNEKFYPDRIIVSGGIANAKAKVSEASKMFDYLTAKGISADLIVKEDKSLTTKQNAEYSVPLAAKLGATEILLCTSSEHMSRRYLNPIKLFKTELIKYPEIVLKAYCQ